MKGCDSVIDISAADSRQEKVKIITQELEKGIKNIFDSDNYKNYLSKMAKLHNYSFSNTMLILMQKPDATMVAGFGSWKNNFNRIVNKGEKGIVILAPAPYKKYVDKKVLDKDGNPKLDSNGKEVFQKEKIQIQAFKPAYVFDVSQTSGDPIPTIKVKELTSDVNDFDKIFDAIKSASPVPILFENITSGAKGYYSHAEKNIKVNYGMGELQTLKTAVHEIAHAMLHDNDYIKTTGERKSRQTKEVEAESVAFTVCSYLGLPTDDYSFGYIAGWSKSNSVEDVKCSMDTIQQCSNRIINKLEARLTLQKKPETNTKSLQTTKSIAI